MKQVTVDGGNINYIDEGEGMPIVLVHGIPTSSFLWREMISDLSAYGRVIALDLPGFGLSDAPADGDYSISNYAAFLNSFLETLSIESAVLICHDFGGPVTVMYALRHPERYQRLIILDTFLHTDLPDWGENDVYIPLSLAKRIHQDIKGSKMEIISNCGHFLQEDESTKLTNIIVNFIDAR